MEGSQNSSHLNIQQNDVSGIGVVSTEDSAAAGPAEEDRSFVIKLDEVSAEHVSIPSAEKVFDLDSDKLNRLANLYLENSERKELDYLASLGSTSGLEKALKSDLNNGLCKSFLLETERIKNFGDNRLPKPKLTSFWQFCLQAFNDFILIILVIAGLISIIAGVLTGDHIEIDWIEGFSIWVAVCIVVLVTAGNDWGKQKQFEILSTLKDDKKCSVIRNGKPEEISVFGVMVGDVLIVEMGDEVPADCVVIQSDRLKMDESSLTGESDATKKAPLDECLVEKKEKQLDNSKSSNISSPIVVSSSAVSTGTGKLLVVATGINSTAGSLFQKLTTGFDTTPLQNKLNALAHHIGAAGLGSAIVTALILILQFWIMYLISPSQEVLDTALIQHVEFALIGITVIVVAVPEGLPLAVTLALAYSVNRMLKDHNFVRRLQACEIMGGADEICSDKTGTLTENKMTVHSLWNGESTRVVSEANMMEHPPLPHAFMEPFVTGMALNNNSYIQKEEVQLQGVKNKGEKIVGVGSSTDCALLFFLSDLGYNYNDLRAKRNGEQRIVHQECFSSSRKMMTTVVKLGDTGKYRVYVKGAAEKVLGLSSHRLDSKGQLMSMNEQEKNRIEKVVIHQMASLALRPICLSYKDFYPEVESDWKNLDESTNLYGMEKSLTCLGIVGMRDPVRRGVPSSIRQCKAAGIRVRMITGDNIETAKQIAVVCHIYNPEAGGLAMLGPEFYKLVGGVVCSTCKTEVCACPLDERSAAKAKQPMRVDVLGDMEAFKRIHAKLEVLARSHPRDKYAFVIGLKAMGSVVAVTGDGTNDAPALKKADVGFAMGISGKEVAKLAADIIILDDNFESVVKAVKWGRSIYENIRRFLAFQLTVNIVAVSFTMLTALIIRTSPLTAMQLLWVNLIMDSFASLALATEHPSDELLLRKPTRRDEYLISKNMFGMMISQAFYQLVVLFVLVFAGDLFIPESPWTNVTEMERWTFDFCEFAGQTASDCTGGNVRSGRLFFPFDPTQDYTAAFLSNFGPSRHMTVVFNTFVWLQVFNLLNARNPQRDWRIFRGILQNRVWILITVGIVLCQSLIIQFGSIVMSCHDEGLTPAQWGISIAFGSGSILVHMLMKLFPSRVLPEAGQKEIDPTDEPRSFALASRGRISREKASRRIVAGLDTQIQSGTVLKGFTRSQTQIVERHSRVLRSSTTKL